MEQLSADTREISKMIQGLMNYLTLSEYRGPKFKESG